MFLQVHGGVTKEDIVQKVTEAVEVAKRNNSLHPELFTVLFFDEANATEAIGLIKEIMCDHTINGRPILHPNCKLHLIAACNPYRKHSNEMIKKLEQAGLGYHVNVNETQDCLGHIPMRQLVYRVQALPQSMLPLVWDFGQLSERVEMMYIKQMVHRYLSKHPDLLRMIDSISRIIAESQNFMRRHKVMCIA